MRERNNRIFKLVDRTLGPAIVLFLGVFLKRKRHNNNSINPRIAILKTGAFGDALLVGPAIRKIKDKWPEANITFICTASNVQAVRGIKEVDRFVVFDLNNPISAFLSLGKLGLYDIVFDFAPWASLNAIISVSLKSKIRYGFKTSGMHRHYIYDFTIEHSSANHELDNYRNLVSAAGIKGSLPFPVFAIDYTKITKNDVFTPGKSVVFHPFPGGAKRDLKRWPMSKWIELGKRIVADGYQVIISGGLSDAEEAKKLVSAISIKNATSLAGKVDLNTMANIIKKTGFLISIDTGTMHLGAAVGATVISLHGPTSELRWGGCGKNVHVISSNAPCSPCVSLGFESKCKMPVCMEAISTDSVYKCFSERTRKKHF